MKSVNKKNKPLVDVRKRIPVNIVKFFGQRKSTLQELSNKLSVSKLQMQQILLDWNVQAKTRRIGYHALNYEGCKMQNFHIVCCDYAKDTNKEARFWLNSSINEKHHPNKLAPIIPKSMNGNEQRTLPGIKYVIGNSQLAPQPVTVPIQIYIPPLPCPPAGFAWTIQLNISF